MSAFLVDIYPSLKNDPSDFIVFFDAKKEKPILSDFVKDRECPLLGFPLSCDANLFFCFFFDGTNNNMKRDLAFHSHSNVARLYHALPGGKDTHGSDVWLCKLETRQSVSKGVKARALSLGHLCIGT